MPRDTLCVILAEAGAHETLLAALLQFQLSSRRDFARPSLKGRRWDFIRFQHVLSRHDDFAQISKRIWSIENIRIAKKYKNIKTIKRSCVEYISLSVNYPYTPRETEFNGKISITSLVFPSLVQRKGRKWTSKEIFRSMNYWIYWKLTR